MKRSTWLVLSCCSLLGACAAPEPPSLPPIVLAGLVRDAPRDAACVALIAQAVQRDAQRGFTRAGMLNTNIVARPGAPRPPASAQTTLVPDGSHAASEAVLLMDGTRRRLFVDCVTRQAYVSQRGGVIDVTYWYGPYAL